jgi:hypothetical protein
MIWQLLITARQYEQEAKYDYVFVYFCINFVESEFEVRVTVTYELTNPTDAHAYKCSQKAVEAFYTLETLMDDLEVFLANKTTSEACLLDIQRVLLQWRKSNNV